MQGPSMSYQRGRQGFTLIELLVVISIISLLISLLLPALKGAREASRAIHCSSSLRQVAVAWVTFANSNKDRGPGAAKRTSGGNTYYWQNILNYDIFNDRNQGTPVDQTQPIQTLNQYQGVSALGARNLGCPNLNDKPGAFRRSWVANAEACGGPNWLAPPGGITPSAGGPGYYGKESSHALFQFRYSLGTRLDMFKKPSLAFMVFEGGRSTDTDPYRGTEDLSGVTPAYPYSGSSGQFGFRHIGLSGNFLMMDGHAQANTPQGELKKTWRFSINGN